ncbi:MAG TPA: hypothetical protein VGV09_02070 [Steroidobacteraceae bacterium]|nr:hypothetical protein [Steroidobacteraceae bacterium]
MNRKLARTWTAWLLPALLLRSLIPIGFMPMIGPGHGVELVLCDGYAPVPSMPASEPMQMSNDMPMATGHHGTHQDHGLCLYGTSPALGTPLALSTHSTHLQATAELLATAPQVSHYEAPYRAQSARGPPA